jgi:hypothetical protein
MTMESRKAITPEPAVVELDDARLMALLRKFRPIFAEYLAFRPICAEACERREAEVSRRIGIRTHCGFRSKAEAQLYWEELKRVDAEMGTDAMTNKEEEILNRLDPIVAAIRTTPARTLTGLAIKALATTFAVPECWEQPEKDLDYPDQLVRDLIESVCAVAGVDLPRSKATIRSVPSFN